MSGVLPRGPRLPGLLREAPSHAPSAPHRGKLLILVFQIASLTFIF